jgi:hypothetical protein
MAALTGRQTVPTDVGAGLKTAAVIGAREEISRGSDNSGLRYGIYLDTLVGPTPADQLYEQAHPRPWLDAMVATHKVDGLFGVPTRGGGLRHTAFAIEVGEPFPGGHDTLQIVYDWCVRSFPTTRRGGARASVWRDLFIRSDTGWTRVAHLPTSALSACSS